MEVVTAADHVILQNNGHADPRVPRRPSYLYWDCPSSPFPVASRKTREGRETPSQERQTDHVAKRIERERDGMTEIICCPCSELMQSAHPLAGRTVGPGKRRRCPGFPESDQDSWPLADFPGPIKRQGDLSTRRRPFSAQTLERRFKAPKQISIERFLRVY
jgi:hypothetical protein